MRNDTPIITLNKNLEYFTCSCCGQTFKERDSLSYKYQGMVKASWMHICEFCLSDIMKIAIGKLIEDE